MARYYEEASSAATGLTSCKSYPLTTNDYIRAVNYPGGEDERGLDFELDEPFSICVTRKFSTLGINQGIFSNTDSGNVNGMFLLLLTNGTFVFQWRGSVASTRWQVNFAPTTAISTATWYDISLTKSSASSNTAFEAYINGVAMTPTRNNNSTPNAITGQPLDFGAQADGTLYFAEATENMQVVYDIELSAGQVSERANLVSSVPEPQIEYLDSNQILRNRFDDDTYDSDNSRYTVVNDKNTNGYTVNIADGALTEDSPYSSCP